MAFFHKKSICCCHIFSLSLFSLSPPPTHTPTREREKNLTTCEGEGFVSNSEHTHSQNDTRQTNLHFYHGIFNYCTMGIDYCPCALLLTLIWTKLHISTLRYKPGDSFPIHGVCQALTSVQEMALKGLMLNVHTANHWKRYRSGMTSKHNQWTHHMDAGLCWNVGQCYSRDILDLCRRQQRKVVFVHGKLWRERKKESYRDTERGKETDKQTKRERRGIILENNLRWLKMDMTGHFQPWSFAYPVYTPSKIQVLLCVFVLVMT